MDLQGKLAGSSSNLERLLFIVFILSPVILEWLMLQRTLPPIFDQ